MVKSDSGKKTTPDHHQSLPYQTMDSYKPKKKVTVELSQDDSNSIDEPKNQRDYDSDGRSERSFVTISEAAKGSERSSIRKSSTSVGKVIGKSKFYHQENANKPADRRKTSNLPYHTSNILAIADAQEKRRSFKVTYLGKYSQQKFEQIDYLKTKKTLLKKDTREFIEQYDPTDDKITQKKDASDSFSVSRNSSQDDPQDINKSSIHSLIALDQPEKDQQLSFDIKDLSSLQEASIDQNLVENFMLQRIEQKNETIKQRIDKHSKIYGYVKQNTIEQLSKQLTEFQSKILKKNNDLKYSKEMRTKDQKYIQTLNQQLDLIEEETKFLQFKTNDIAKVQFQEEIQEDIDPFVEFAPSEQDESNHNKRVQTQIVDHEKYDKINQMRMNVEYLDTKHNRDKQCRIQLIEKAKSEKLESQMHLKHLKKVKFTISQDTVYFKIWNILILINCLISTVMYPYFMIQDVHNLLTKFLWQQIMVEFFFFVNIIISFFKQELNEDGTSKTEPWKKVAFRYLYSRSFKLDLVAFIPWGYMGYINPNLSFMWFIKILRIQQLDYYMSNNVILQPVEMYIKIRQEKCLKDTKRRVDINQDSIFINEKIQYRYVIKMLRLVMQVFIIAYLVGQYWFIFCLGTSTDDNLKHFEEHPKNQLQQESFTQIQQNELQMTMNQVEKTIRDYQDQIGALQDELLDLNARFDWQDDLSNNDPNGNEDEDEAEEEVNDDQNSNDEGDLRALGQDNDDPKFNEEQNLSLEELRELKENLLIDLKSKLKTAEKVKKSFENQDDDVDLYSKINESFVLNDDWNIVDEEMFKKSLISLYFAMTSLTTVGFGDYYPKNDHERLVGAFVLLTGVASFSYILGELLANIEQMRMTEQYEGDLDRFLSVLRFYNNNMPVDKKFQNELREFLSTRQEKNKNNFIAKDEDLQLYEQLPDECKMHIYTEFLFKDFLYKFRRFLSLRVPIYLEQLKEHTAKQTKKVRSDTKNFDINATQVHKTTNITKFQRGVNKLKFAKKTGNMMNKLRTLKQSETQLVSESDMEQSTDPIYKPQMTAIKEEGQESPQQHSASRKKQLVEATEVFLAQQIQNKRKEQFKLYAERQINELKAGIKYPFYTFQDDEYASFVTSLLHCLQFRHFKSMEIIQEELDQCLEILFVENGKYDVGYEMNKKKIFRRQFGASTIIGGFQISYEQRNRFVIRAHTEMQCQAILKKDWMALLKDYPKFNEQIKQKLLVSYYHNMFRPLNKLKNKDIKSFFKRNDFDQILTLHESREAFVMKYFIDPEVIDKTQEYMKFQNEQQMLLLIIDKLNQKISTLFENRVKIAQHTYDVSKILQDKMVDLLDCGRLVNSNGQEISKYVALSEIREKVISIDKQRKLRKMEKLDIIQYNLEKQIKKLQKVVEPKKKFEAFIRQRQDGHLLSTAINVVQGEDTKTNLLRRTISTRLNKNIKKTFTRTAQRFQESISSEEEFSPSDTIQRDEQKHIRSVTQNILSLGMTQIDDEESKESDSNPVKTDPSMQSNENQPQFNSQTSAQEESNDQIQSNNQIETNNNQDQNREAHFEERKTSQSGFADIRTEQQSNAMESKTENQEASNQISFYPETNQNQSEIAADEGQLNQEQNEAIAVAPDGQLNDKQVEETSSKVEEASSKNNGSVVKFGVDSESLKKPKITPKVKAKKGKKIATKKTV